MCVCVCVREHLFKKKSKIVCALFFQTLKKRCDEELRRRDFHIMQVGRFAVHLSGIWINAMCSYQTT